MKKVGSRARVLIFNVRLTVKGWKGGKTRDGRNARRPEADAKQNVNCVVIFRRGEGMANEMEGEIDGEGHESSVAASFCARSWEEGGEEGGESVAAHKSDINRR